MTGQTTQPRVFAEEDYCYGVGPLTLRVEQVDWTKPVRFDNDIWYYVDGVEFSATGVERDRRQVLIRGRCLQRDTA